jgi:deoxyribodipyrimidine photo-lyase
MAQRIVYWFRNDLRLTDNEAFLAATNAAKEIIPVFVFDPRQFEHTKLGFRRTSVLRAQFLIETVANLRNKLREKGGDLLIRIGEPESIIAQLADDYRAEYVYTSKEIGPEETRIESSLSKRLKVSNVDIKLFWMHTLSHAKDLPFPISKLPLGFDHYYQQIKNQPGTGTPVSKPLAVTLPQEYEAGVIPSLPALGMDPQESSSLAISIDVSATSDEATAREHLRTCITGEALSEKSADALTDCKLSHYLALGGISARSIYYALQDIQGPDSLKEALLKSLFKRDYFHWTLLRYGPRLFKPSGVIHHFEQRWLNDKTVFQRWIDGNTADEEINHIMSKVKTTGCISSAEWEKAASYLVQKENINWTWGAMYFESFLTDYSVSVNWGKWNNLAGVGAN